MLGYSEPFAKGADMDPKDYCTDPSHQKGSKASHSTRLRCIPCKDCNGAPVLQDRFGTHKSVHNQLKRDSAPGATPDLKKKL